MIAAAVLIALLLGEPVQSPASTFDPLTEFQTVCLGQDGDLAFTEDIVIELGYQRAQDRVDAFRPLGSADPASYTYAWSKTVDDADVQVMARPRAFIRQGTVRAYLDICSVSIAPGQRGKLRAAVSRRLGLDSFRQGDASVFAWTPGPEAREPIHRTVFENNLIPLLRERGMRVLTVSGHNRRVILSYWRPSRADCRVKRDFSQDGPNIICGVTEP